MNKSGTHGLAVRLLGTDIPLFGTRRVYCPWCGEPHMTISRNQSGLAYMCHRASCGVSGYELDNGTGAPADGWVRPPATHYEGAIFGVTAEDLKFFEARFGLHDIHGEVHVTDLDEYLLSIHGPRGEVRGSVVRQPVWAERDGIVCPRTGRRGQPRAKVYADTDRPLVAWYGYPASAKRLPVVICEDQISALRAAQCGYRTVSIMGSHLTQSQVAEISANAPTGVVLALDEDATDKAFKLGRHWGLAFAKFRVAVLAEDIKDTDTDDNIRAILGS